jgi:hypothetical protein
MAARITAVAGGKDPEQRHAIGGAVQSDDEGAKKAEGRLEHSGDELEERIEHLGEQIEDLEGKAAAHKRHAGQEPVRESDAGLAKDEEYEG